MSIYNPNGSLQHKIVLSPDIYGSRNIDNVIQKPNGNILLASVDDYCERGLTEIDMDGNIERQYMSSLGGSGAVNFVDSSGRIVITNTHNGIELLDSELNPLNFTGPQLNGGLLDFPNVLDYNRERNEAVGFCCCNKTNTVLTIFGFTEE